MVKGSVFVLSVAARDCSLTVVQIAWADAASCAPPLMFFFLILYHRPGLHTSHIKPAEQSRLTNVRRGACEVVSLLSLTRHPVLPPPPPSHFQRQVRRLLFLWEKKFKKCSVKARGRKARPVGGESRCRGVNLPRREAKLSLKLPLWRRPWESREDNGTRLISLFGLLV